MKKEIETTPLDIQSLNDTSMDRHILADTYIESARAAKKEYNYDSAVDYYEKALRIREELFREEATPQAEERVAFLYRQLGKLHLDHSGYEKAEFYYRKALSIDEEFYEKSKTIETESNLYDTLTGFCDLYTDQKSYEQAEAYGRRLLEMFRKYHISEQNERGKEQLEGIYERLGNIALISGNPEQAAPNFHKALDVNRTIDLKSAPDYTVEDTEVLDRRAWYYDRLGYTAWECEDWEVARQFYKESITSHQLLVKITDEYKYYSRLLEAYDGLIHVRLEGNNVKDRSDEIFSHVQDMMDLLNVMMEIRKTRESLKIHSTLGLKLEKVRKHREVALLFDRVGDTDMVMMHMQEADRIMKELEEKYTSR